MARRAPEKIGQVLLHTRIGAWRNWDPVVLSSLAQMIELQTDVPVTLLPWRGATAVLIVNNPTERRVLEHRTQRAQEIFDTVLGRGRVRAIRIKVRD